MSRCRAGWETETVESVDTEEATVEDSFQYSDESSLFKIRHLPTEPDSEEKSLKETMNKVHQVALESPDAQLE